MTTLLFRVFFSFCLGLLLPISPAFGQSAEVTIDSQLFPADAGIVEGTGTFPLDSYTSIQITAAEGWYIHSIGLPEWTQGDTIMQLWALSSLGNKKPDYFAGSVEATQDKTVIVRFTNKFPTITADLQDVVAAGDLTLSFQANGLTPLSVQWFKDGLPLVAPAEDPWFSTEEFEEEYRLIISHAHLTNSGTYSVQVTNDFGSAQTRTASVEILPVGVFAKTGSTTHMLTNQTFSFARPHEFSLKSSFKDGPIFYTLDGSTPTVTSTLYTSPFSLDEPAVLNAIAYGQDFSEIASLDPINLNKVRGFTLNTISPFSTSLSPQPPYLAGEVVTAVPSGACSECVFLGWEGSLVSTQEVISLSIQADTILRPLWSLPVGISITGSGSVQGATSFVPYGESLHLHALPDPGFFFLQWTGTHPGTDPHLRIDQVQTSVDLTGVFAPLPEGKHSVSAVSIGCGSVSVSPALNLVDSGTEVTFTAVPAESQRFLGWSGGASGTENPVTIMFDQSTTMTAQFTSDIYFTLRQIINAEHELSCIVAPSETGFQVEQSADLHEWIVLYKSPGSAQERTITIPLRATAGQMTTGLCRSMIRCNWKL